MYNIKKNFFHNIKKILYLIFINLFLIIFQIKKKKISLNFNNEYLFFNNYYIKNSINLKITLLNISYSLRFNKTRVEYNIYFYNYNYNLIMPSDITFEYEINIICHMKLFNEIIFDSLANIHLNKYYNCIQYFNLNETISLGVKIFREFEEYPNRTIYFFNDSLINYNNINFKNDIIFNPFFIEKNYLQILKNLKIISLKRSFIKNPLYLNSNIENNIWIFKNLYNNYFCFCKGLNCFYKKIANICKYKFYLYIIDNNRNIYNKSNYLLADFLGDFESSDDSFPVFEELIKQNKKAFYMTKKNDIYIKYCRFNKKCKIIIHEIFIDGNFLEKYLELILRLKAVISGSEYLSIDNLFYNIEYITFISLTHGINYFKAFLYNGYYSPKKYNKIVTSPSKKVVSLAMKYGWDNNNIIKICFPKWDKFDKYKKLFFTKEKVYSNPKKSIFLFFTWRNLLNNENISVYYFKNILNLINNNLLRKIIEDKNITLYYSLHHMFEFYRKKIKITYNNFIFISQNKIFKCLLESNLIITDFSSVIFDMIYQRKPFIIYIPDLDDPNITSIYDSYYCNILNDLKNGTLYFENKYFNINDAVNKIIYYIENDYKLEPKLEFFYDSFEFKCNNNTQNFINYLEKLK